MADMNRETCMEIFEKYDQTAGDFHKAHPQAFSDLTVGYAKYLLKLNEKKEDK